MVLPIVHLNGTSRDDLVEQRLAIVDALRLVANAIADGWPNDRDYYPQGQDAIQAARELWRGRLDTLDFMRQEIEDEARAILDQEGDSA